jgi:hypothetical protein
MRVAAALLAVGAATLLRQPNEAMRADTAINAKDAAQLQMIKDCLPADGTAVFDVGGKDGSKTPESVEAVLYIKSWGANGADAANYDSTPDKDGKVPGWAKVMSSKCKFGAHDASLADDMGVGGLKPHAAQDAAGGAGVNYVGDSADSVAAAEASMDQVDAMNAKMEGSADNEALKLTDAQAAGLAAGF